MFKSILVPIDLGQESSWQKTLPCAIDLARSNTAKLSVITVMPDFGLPMVGVSFPDDFEKKGHARMSDVLSEIVAKNVPNGVDVHSVVAQGTIYSEIMKTADKLGCDLIIMSSHRPEMSDYLLGTNAARVVRHAKQSVFVIRD